MAVDRVFTIVDRFSLLTPAERRAVEYRCRMPMRTIKEAAWELGVTEQTQKNHWTQVLRKAGCHTAADVCVALAAREAFAEGAGMVAARADEV